jgi:hypothetical protein
LKRRKKRWGFMGKWAKMLLTPMGDGRRRAVDAESKTEWKNERDVAAKVQLVCKAEGKWMEKKRDKI